MSEKLDLKTAADAESDTESLDSQATVVIEDDTFNPIRLIDCAALIEPGRDIVRRMGIFEYQGKRNTALYQSSGTSGSPLLGGTYVPFYGETNKLLKAIDINPNTQRNDWKMVIKEICKLAHSILNYFEDFYELQISASIDSPFWNRLSCRDFILSREWNEITREFDLLPEPIPHSGHFSEMDCARRIVMETGEINDFLRSNKVKIGERQIEAYRLQQQQQQQLEEEDNKEKIGRLKTEEGGTNKRKSNKRKSKKLKSKKRKSKKRK